MKKINILVKGMHCKSCKSIIETEVEVLPGVAKIDVNNKTGKGIIEFDENKINTKKIFSVITGLKYSVEEIKEEGRRETKGSYKKFAMLGSVGALLLVGYFIINSLPSSPDAAPLKAVAAVKNIAAPAAKVNDGYLGDPGISVIGQNDKIYIDEKTVNDGDLHAFNYYSNKAGKNIYFFVLRAPDGTYRAAANACEVCNGSKKGFTQVGDLIRCENCRVTYEKSKIAQEKGGCNPGPIDKNVAVNDGSLEINLADVEAVSYLF